MFELLAGVGLAAAAGLNAYIPLLAIGGSPGAARPARAPRRRERVTSGETRRPDA